MRNSIYLPSFVSLSVSQSSASNSSVTAIGAIRFGLPSIFLFFVARDEGTLGEDLLLYKLFNLGELPFTVDISPQFPLVSEFREPSSMNFLFDNRGELEGELPVDDLRSKIY